MTELIQVRDLTKEFRIAKKDPGLGGAVKHLFSRRYETITGVDSVSFCVAPGETVGYIGRNGAGKSTTIKMLTGILVPTRGEIHVDGIVPYRKRSENGRRIGVVFGQRTHLRWDIPVRESYRLLREIYQVPTGVFDSNLAFFTEVLELDGLLSRPARKLSLGQRMKCDLAAAFLHDPRIVYLDEPTIGLDVIVKENVREFIKEVNRKKGTTVILTTHDMRDIEDICRRSIVIDEGRIIYDGALSEIRKRFGNRKTITFELRRAVSPREGSRLDLPRGTELEHAAEHSLRLSVDPEVISSSDAARHVMERWDVADMSIQEASIESVVKKLLQEKRDPDA